MLEVPEEKGVNVIVLGENSVMVQGAAMQTIKLFESRGLQVVQVDTSEFSKLDGAVTCKSVRVRQLPRDSPFF